MAKIIHNKIPTNESGSSLLSCKTIENIHNYIKDALNEFATNEEYIIITTPTDLKVIDGTDTILILDCKEYSYNQLKSIIEKAWMYDDLNK